MSERDEVTSTELEKILESHARWLRGEVGSRANLRGADLTGANLADADLRDANLRGANLTDADLTDANLRGANLTDADLTDANLRGANLRGANLTDADLTGANLTDADLRGANLTDANLRGANLRGANLTGAYLGHRRILPEEGTIIGWKKLRGGIICKLQIDASRAVSSLVGRKCRAAEAVVLEGEGSSIHSRTFAYRVGEVVRPAEPFSDDVRIECASGIHFFLTRAEAEEYQ